MIWNNAQRKQMKSHGVTEQEIERQLELFRNPPPPLKITRACTPGDGIIQLKQNDRAALKELFDAAAAKGRFSRFIPASGAASRMFKKLFNSTEAQAEWQSQGQCPNYPFHECFFKNISRFAFLQGLQKSLEKQGLNLKQVIAGRDMAPVLEALLGPSGLNYAKRPKGLLDFHAYPSQARSPLEEHLSEALKLANGKAAQLHFTVSPEFLGDFQQAALHARDKIGAPDQPVEISFSCQQSATDTIAVNLDNQVLQNERGELIFRPSGHGALLHNLQEVKGDLVLVKNIDNVVPENQQPEVIDWWKVLGGKLIQIQQRVAAVLHQLESSEDEQSCIEAEKTLLELGLESRTKQTELPGRRKELFSRLHRPIRVCGMVRNSGEPGGGPFWVAGIDGETPQIVEMAQIPENDPQAKAAIAQATHFNPVLMACGLRDHQGRPYPLSNYIDKQAIIITRKSEQGRELKALERPGLWNGAMAGWLTLFMEVPEKIFQPVKTVNDLLRPGHQVQQTGRATSTS